MFLDNTLVWLGMMNMMMMMMIMIMMMMMMMMMIMMMMMMNDVMIFYKLLVRLAGSAPHPVEVVVPWTVEKGFGRR